MRVKGNTTAWTASFAGYALALALLGLGAAACDGGSSGGESGQAGQAGQAGESGESGESGQAGEAEGGGAEGTGSGADGVAEPTLAADPEAEGGEGTIEGLGDGSGEGAGLDEALEPGEDPDAPGLSPEERERRRERRRLLVAQRRERALAEAAEAGAEPAAGEGQAQPTTGAGQQDAAAETDERDPTRRLVRAMRRDANGEGDGPWDALTLPRTAGGITPVPVGLVVTVTEGRVRVNGRDALTLRRGRLRDDDVLGDLTVPALADAVGGLAAAAAETAEPGAAPVAESAAFLIHRDTPYRTAFAVIETLRAGATRTGYAGAYWTPFAGLWSDAATDASVLHLVEIGMPRTEPTRVRGGQEFPRILVEVTAEGFAVSDLNGGEAFGASDLGEPIQRCAAEPLRRTICLLPADQTVSDRLIDRLDFRGLYNRLYEIRRYEGWAAAMPADTGLFLRAADDVPWEVVMRVAETLRNELGQARFRQDNAFRTAEVAETALFPRLVFVAPRADMGPNLVAEAGEGALPGVGVAGGGPTRVGSPGVEEPTAADTAAADAPPAPTGGEGDGEVDEPGQIRARLSDFSAQEGLPANVVERVMRRNRRRLADCATAAGATSGTATITWTIGDGGTASNVSVSTRDMAGGTEVTDCLTERVLSIQFPAPRSGDGRASVTLTLGD